MLSCSSWPQWKETEEIRLVFIKSHSNQPLGTACPSAKILKNEVSCRISLFYDVFSRYLSWAHLGLNQSSMKPSLVNGCPHPFEIVLVQKYGPDDLLRFLSVLHLCEDTESSEVAGKGNSNSYWVTALFTGMVFFFPATGIHPHSEFTCCWIASR